jgi:hypothetical protein
MLSEQRRFQEIRRAGVIRFGEFKPLAETLGTHLGISRAAAYKMLRVVLDAAGIGEVVR